MRIDLAAGADARQHLLRDAESVEHLGIPREGFEIHQLGATGVRDIGDVNAAMGASSQVPDEKTIDVAKQDVSSLSHLADSFNVFENPTDFQTAKIGTKR